MANVLLIYDDRNVKLAVEQVLATLSISPIHLFLGDFSAEFLLAEMFDLIIFELFGENRSCIAILNQLEKLAITSGFDHPPVIVATEQGFSITEQALRTAKVNFFFVKPIDEMELIAAIRHCLGQSIAP
jgi:DNA-binding response OmpR family regulator